MSRQARKKSESGIYHVMLRGINKQRIFYNEQDYKMFIKSLIAAKDAGSFSLYAYCLMDNHIHLLIKEEGEALATVIKRIACRFVYWYNLKYERVGHLFQDRFRSEPVDTDEYFVSVLRYIHQNPVKAGLVASCKEYTYSSYQWYFVNSKLINKDFALSLMSEEQFKEFHTKLEKKSIMDLEETKKRISDEKAQELFKKITKCENATEFATLEKKQRRKFGAQLKELGLSNRQIVNNTGLSYSWIEGIKLKK
ncbi:MAG: transposase [Clostridia bacterium]|nr:transposase [Clostridia bacterium]